MDFSFLEKWSTGNRINFNSCTISHGIALNKGFESDGRFAFVLILIIFIVGSVVIFVS